MSETSTGRRSSCLPWDGHHIAPGEDCEENMSSFVYKVSAPVIVDIALDVITKLVEEQQGCRTGQHGFTQWKSCLPNPVAF